MKTFIPRQIIVDKNIATHQKTLEILGKLQDISYKIVDNIEQEISAFNNQEDAFYKGKSILMLTELKGELLKDCPGTNNYLCCGYKILNSGLNCHFNCQYCYLQDYMSIPFITVFVNLVKKVDELFQQIGVKEDKKSPPWRGGRFLEKSDGVGSSGEKRYRIGTGEFTDSLILDHLTSDSLELIERVKKYPNIILELKTKSVNIENLLTINPPNNIVVSWSVNPQEIIDVFEPDASSLVQRMYAAKQLSEKGYKVAFHFDPLIYFEGYQKAYAEVVEAIYQNVQKDKVLWISMGALRYTKGMKKILLKRFKGVDKLLIDTVVGDDGKIRYFRPKREELFKAVLSSIKKESPSQYVYLCMESDLVWQNVFGYAPKDDEDFAQSFDQAVFY